MSWSWEVQLWCLSSTDPRPQKLMFGNWNKWHPKSSKATELMWSIVYSTDIRQWCHILESWQAMQTYRLITFYLGSWLQFTNQTTHIMCLAIHYKYQHQTIPYWNTTQEQTFVRGFSNPKPFKVGTSQKTHPTRLPNCFVFSMPPRSWCFVQRQSFTAEWEPTIL